MTTDGSTRRPALRRSETGAVLVVVLLAMIALLGMGLTGLYLTSGSIQMSSNINMRNQALYVAEAGIQTAKSLLNRTIAGFPGMPLNVTGMLAGNSPMGTPVALPSGLADKIPLNATGCLGVDSDGNPTPGAYLRDEPGLGCRPGTSAYVDCNYPASISHNQATPDNSSPVLAQFMGTYTLFIRQDLAECRQGYFTDENPVRNPNNIIIIRSEGTASDNRTKVVLEVTMSPNPNTTQVQTGIASVCSAGQAGCDDNASVQQGITVSGSLTPPPPGAGGAGGTTGAGGAGGSAGGAGGGAGGAGGSSTTTPVAGSGAGGAAGGAAGGTTGTGGTAGTCGTGCPSGQTCCNGACVDLTTNTSNCGQCGNACASQQMCCVGLCQADPGCPSIATMGVYGPWDANSTTTGVVQFQKWLTQHSNGCKAPKQLDIYNSSVGTALNSLGTTGYVVILLDVIHDQTDLTQFLAGGKKGYYRGAGDSQYTGNMRVLTTTGQGNDAQALGQWVRAGGGLATTLGISCLNYERAFPNRVLQYATDSTNSSNPSNQNIVFLNTSPNVCVFRSQTAITGTWAWSGYSAGGGLYGFKRYPSHPTLIPEAITNSVNKMLVSGAYVLSTTLTDSVVFPTFSSYTEGQETVSGNKYLYLVGAAGDFGSGRLNVWGDEWLTYDDVWNNYDANIYWDNVIKWLGKCQ